MSDTADGRDDHVGLEQLAERVPQRGLDVDPLGPGLDQRPVAHRHHQLVAQPRGQFPQPDQGDHEHRPARRCRRYGTRASRTGVMHHGGDGGAGRRPRRSGCPAPGQWSRSPWPWPGPPAGEKSRIRAGVATRQTALDQAEHEEVAMPKAHLVVAAGMMNAVNTPGEQQPADHQVGPAPAGRRARRTAIRRRRPGCRRPGSPRKKVKLMCRSVSSRVATEPTDVELVVQRDRGQDRDGQVEHPRPGIGIGIELAAPEPVPPSAPARGQIGSSRTHAVLAIVVDPGSGGRPARAGGGASALRALLATPRDKA